MFTIVFTVVAIWFLSPGSVHGGDLYTPPASPKIVKSLAKRLSEGMAEQRHHVWVLFTDKGIQEEEFEKHLKRVAKLMPERTLQRRRKMLPDRSIADFYDLPVAMQYLRAIEATGIKVRTISKWFNGVGAEATRAQIEMLKDFPFVRRIDPVRSFRRDEPGPPEERPSERPLPGRSDYGVSYTQVAQLHVPELHDLEYTGKGIRVCMLDTGYDYRHHDAFRRLNIIATRDFIYGDSEVADEVGQDAGDREEPQHTHGTRTLSVLGGYDPGKFVGIAYDAEFLLGKTENVASETPIEEDFWVAGVEWADSLGSDIISSSLGYSTWDPETGTDYTREDLDGETAKTTRAATIAVAKGIVVVNSAGNEGNDVWQKILMPADGKEVIAVGAVDAQGLLAPFSSLGPTADGRIKPDVVAPGIGVWSVDVVSPTGYVQRNGTSFSCPLVSGVCALLLQAHPTWTPVQVGRALRETARDLGPAGPDTLYGWGLVDALAAVNFEADSTLVPDEPDLPGEEIDGIVVYPPFPNPSQGVVYFPFKLAADTSVGLEVFSPSGELVARVGPHFFYKTGEYRKWEPFMWSGEKGDSAMVPHRDSLVSPGVYFYRLDFGGKKIIGKVAIVR